MNIKVLFSLILLLSWFYGFSEKNKPENNISLGDDKYVISKNLKKGNGKFDPWNKLRWKDWYNENGELLYPFIVDESVKFESRTTPWKIKFSKKFSERALFVIKKQGIVINGNGVILDARIPNLMLPLDELFKLRKKPWTENCEIIGISYDLPEVEEIQPTKISNLTLKGLKRGIKINGTGIQEQHRLIVQNCTFTRNRVGFYTNGYNTLLKDCQLFENGYGAIYSGSKSRRNQFIGNSFRDNTLSQHQHSYGDFIGDTFFDSEIKNNIFEKSHIKEPHRRIGISMFRNMGESNKLRKQMPHNNIISNNNFYNYSVAIHIGARMGRNTRNDITDEGRDYAFYNLIDSNYIEDSEIGIKINSEGNTISGNTFKNVKSDIVLHCVFFKLKNTIINYQKHDKVNLWYTLDDYKQYASWFKFQDDLNGFIKKEEKLISVFSTIESPEFNTAASDVFLFNPPDPGQNNLFFDHRNGAPKRTTKGELSLDLPGQETVAIWSNPISRINDTDYYSIIIFDEKGTEINRCGRSEIKWKQVTTGHFVRKDGEMEIAAIPATPVDGKYPVYIFDRGFREPKEVIYKNNTNSNISISSNSENELVVNF